MPGINISQLLSLNMVAAGKVSQEKIARQEESDQDLNNLAEMFDGQVFNSIRRIGQFKKSEELKSSSTEKQDKTEEAKILEIEEVEELANQFQKTNYELNNKTLLILRERLSPYDTPEEILDKVRSFYPDPSLADEALDFLLQSAKPDLAEKIKTAKELLNTDYAREIKAGRNMGAQAREFAQEGLGSATSLRDLYRDLTGMVRDPLKLFNDLTEKFQYDKMKPAINFLLHSLGSDLKSKGPSISPGELKKLIDDTRSLQGILGVFRFFQSRLPLILQQFTLNQLLFPEQTDFELLSRTFIKLLQERYINPDKIRQTGHLLGISEELLAQIIVFNQMREAIRQIAPRYYRSPQHKEELTKAFIDLIEKLDDELEEEEEEEEEEE